MPKPFEPTFKDLDRDIERHVERFGTPGSLLGAKVIYGTEKSRRTIFDAYVKAGADEAITTWLTKHWNYIFGTNPFFDETMDRFCRERAIGRVSRLWRHVCAEQIENYRILKAHRDLKGAGKSIAEAKQRVLVSMREWRRCLVQLGEDDACRRLDEAIADFEADRRKPVSRKPDPRKIDDALFWQIIAADADSSSPPNTARGHDGAKEKSAGGPAPSAASASERVEQITDRLAGFSASQIKVFDKLLWEVMQRLNHWDIWAMAYLLQDGCSDDAFEGFRAWVILHGREACELVSRDPETFLARVDTRGTLDGSALLHAPAIAFDRRAGKALRMAKRPPVQIQGTPWQEETVEQTYRSLASWIAARKERP